MNVGIETKRTIVERKGRVPFFKKEEKKYEENTRSLSVGQATHIDTPLGTLMMEEDIQTTEKNKLLIEMRFGDKKGLVAENAEGKKLEASKIYLLTYPEDPQLTYKMENPKTEVVITLLGGPYEDSSVPAKLMPPKPSLEAAVALQIPRE